MQIIHYFPEYMPCYLKTTFLDLLQVDKLIIIVIKFNIFMVLLYILLCHCKFSSLKLEIRKFVFAASVVCVEVF